ncbi:MAG: hydantoinase B/oxoprolinase family protein [Gammaproteobacteria bacterium]|nr:hydantoinase B/oxoprolinase family protein [Gammaproteobacteria bacterium]MDH3467754.1 hydantoinase B/oxoprolinase family protein [Gammaproteobacteria bacterium]
MITATGRLHNQIIWNRLIAVVEEQAQTLMRTAFANTVREAGDLSAGVFDLRGRMLAQAVTGTPGHVNAMAASVGHFLNKFPVADMVPGDVFLTNDPWLGTGHLHDFTVVTPAFRNHKPVALCAATSHVVDIGGLGFGADGRQVFEEGLYVPIMPLAKAGVMNESLLQIVRANVRESVQVEGDLYSLAASNATGCERLATLMEEFELSTIEPLADTLIDTSEQAMLKQIRTLPVGTYRNQMRIDGYEDAVDLVAALTISDSGIDIDFTGTSSVSAYGINVPLPYTQAYASFGVRCLVGADIPNNAGSLAPIRVIAPPGTILNAPHPCAVAARHAIGQMLPDVVLGCLHQVLPQRAPAEGTSCLWNPVLYGGHGLGAATLPFTVTLFHNGGTGARPHADGLSATAFPSGVRNTPVEINEAIAPIVVWRKEYRVDSGGAGQFRGGLGQVMEIASAEQTPFSISSMFDRITYPPRGRENGQPGAEGRFYLRSGNTLRAKGRQTVPAGDRVVMEMPGGGGYGDPLKRDPENVARDVAEGFVSVQSAAEDYGVIFDSDGDIDVTATAATRASRANIDVV